LLFNGNVITWYKVLNDFKKCAKKQSDPAFKYPAFYYTNRQKPWKTPAIWSVSRISFKHRTANT
jgi:hypothetical protein